MSQSLEQISDLQEVFTVFDKEAEGPNQEITRDKLAAVLRSNNFSDSGFSDEDVKDMIDEVAVREGGAMKFPDFLAFMNAPVSEENEKESKVPSADLPMQVQAINEAFKAIDKDNNGVISFDELKEVMKKYDEKITNDEIFGILNMVDPQGDHSISYDAFLRAMLRP
eukprot:TRINITY_DN217_c0_g1_i1.p1 TRINITY_DN217_c0_g1~~TRINITY_DN217_c0_g1_i1.p1  ORF type:complete len:167 (+),score=46.99 TRINITY_DN217_c0_g1_i1:94-594(+)